MRRHLVLVVALTATGTASTAAADSWIFRPSYYTHNPATGKRVNQYAHEKAAYVRTDPTYQQSVYRQSRSGFAIDGTYDFMHTVETWGQGDRIRPYGEWLYPYRAGATPYGPWGNPQGPWTLPFGSWMNPYGSGALPYTPWGSWGAGVTPYRPPAAPPQVSPYAEPPQSAPYAAPPQSAPYVAPPQLNPSAIPPAPPEPNPPPSL